MSNEILNLGFKRIYDNDMEDQRHYIDVIAKEVRHMDPEPIYSMGGVFVPNDEYLAERFGEEIKQYEYGIYRYDCCKYVHYLIFPIYNVYGKICGITGFNPFNKLRKIEAITPEDIEESRALNVYNDTMLAGYDKTSFIFGPKDIYDKAFNEGYIVIVDGFFDAISLQGAGINAGAFLGSMFSDNLASILNLIDRVYIMHDNDKAGLALAKKIKKKIKSAILVSQDGFKDSDEVLKSEYREKFVKEFKEFLGQKYRLPFNFNVKSLYSDV